MRREFNARMDAKGRLIIPGYVTTDILESFDMVDVDPFVESSIQEFPLGSLMIWGDRKFRYCKAGATAPGIGVPTQQAKTLHADADDALAIAVSGAVGDTTLSITGTTNLSSTANIYAEGYVFTDSKEAGGGQCLRIKSHVALNTAATKVITLYDPLRVAVTAGTDTAGLIQNPYKSVIAAEAVVSGAILGVPQFGPTANYYFWMQTGGPAVVLCNAEIALGTEAVAGTSAGEADPAAAATTELKIGNMMTLGVADKYNAIFLTLD